MSASKEIDDSVPNQRRRLERSAARPTSVEAEALREAAVFRQRMLDAQRHIAEYAEFLRQLPHRAAVAAAASHVTTASTTTSSHSHPRRRVTQGAVVRQRADSAVYDPDEIVHFNVGGQRFSVTLRTLQTEPTSILYIVALRWVELRRLGHTLHCDGAAKGRTSPLALWDAPSPPAQRQEIVMSMGGSDAPRTHATAERLHWERSASALQVVDAASPSSFAASVESPRRRISLASVATSNCATPLGALAVHFVADSDHLSTSTQRYQREVAYAAMLDRAGIPLDADGRIFFDRCPLSFSYIIGMLRGYRSRTQADLLVTVARDARFYGVMKTFLAVNAVEELPSFDANSRGHAASSSVADPKLLQLPVNISSVVRGRVLDGTTLSSVVGGFRSSGTFRATFQIVACEFIALGAFTRSAMVSQGGSLPSASFSALTFALTSSVDASNPVPNAAALASAAQSAALNLTDIGFSDGWPDCSVLYHTGNLHYNYNGEWPRIEETGAALRLGDVIAITIDFNKRRVVYEITNREIVRIIPFVSREMCVGVVLKGDSKLVIVADKRYALAHQAGIVGDALSQDEYSPTATQESGLPQQEMLRHIAVLERANQLQHQQEQNQLLDHQARPLHFFIPTATATAGTA